MADRIVPPMAGYAFWADDPVIPSSPVLGTAITRLHLTDNGGYYLILTYNKYERVLRLVTVKQADLSVVTRRENPFGPLTLSEIHLCDTYRNGFILLGRRADDLSLVLLFTDRLGNYQWHVPLSADIDTHYYLEGTFKWARRDDETLVVVGRSLENGTRCGNLIFEIALSTGQVSQVIHFPVPFTTNLLGAPISNSGFIEIITLQPLFRAPGNLLIEIKSRRGTVETTAGYVYNRAYELVDRYISLIYDYSTMTNLGGWTGRTPYGARITHQDAQGHYYESAYYVLHASLDRSKELITLRYVYTGEFTGNLWQPFTTHSAHFLSDRVCDVLFSDRIRRFRVPYPYGQPNEDLDLYIDGLFGWQHLVYTFEGRVGYQQAHEGKTDWSREVLISPDYVTAANPYVSKNPDGVLVVHWEQDGAGGRPWKSISSDYGKTWTAAPL